MGPPVPPVPVPPLLQLTSVASQVPAPKWVMSQYAWMQVVSEQARPCSS
jgi:hypothetical protein